MHFIETASTLRKFLTFPLYLQKFMFNRSIRDCIALVKLNSLNKFLIFLINLQL